MAHKSASSQSHLISLCPHQFLLLELVLSETVTMAQTQAMGNPTHRQVIFVINWQNQEEKK